MLGNSPCSCNVEESGGHVSHAGEHSVHWRYPSNHPIFRRKKIKCDGVEPTCSQCSASGSQCTWLQTKDRAALSRQYVNLTFLWLELSSHQSKKLSPLAMSRNLKLASFTWNPSLDRSPSNLVRPLMA